MYPFCLLAVKNTNTNTSKEANFMTITITNPQKTDLSIDDNIPSLSAGNFNGSYL